jgi:hypothetical protein
MTAIINMAMHICRNYVREEIKRRGEKLRDYSFGRLNELAREYLLEHIDQVLDQVVADERKLRASLTTLAQQRKLSNHSTIPVQISGAK